MKTKNKKTSPYHKNWPNNEGQNYFIFAIINMRYSQVGQPMASK